MAKPAVPVRRKPRIEYRVETVQRYIMVRIETPVPSPGPRGRVADPVPVRRRISPLEFTDPELAHQNCLAVASEEAKRRGYVNDPDFIFPQKQT